MENAADALKMAAAVLIFVLALSISINAFGEARATSQAILNYNDREYEYTYVEENRDENGEILTERLVGVETIVPSIYKAYKENYKIIFDISFLDGKGLYKKRNSEGGTDPIYSIDLEKEVLGNDSQKEKFIEAILYGANSETKAEFEKNLGIYLNDTGIYGTIKGKKFKEYLGVYYQEEVDGESQTPEANKTRKRVITYTDK